MIVRLRTEVLHHSSTLCALGLGMHLWASLGKCEVHFRAPSHASTRTAKERFCGLAASDGLPYPHLPAKYLSVYECARRLNLARKTAWLPYINETCSVHRISESWSKEAFEWKDLGLARQWLQCGNRLAITYFRNSAPQVHAWARMAKPKSLKSEPKSQKWIFAWVLLTSTTWKKSKRIKLWNMSRATLPSWKNFLEGLPETSLLLLQQY